METTIVGKNHFGKSVETNIPINEKEVYCINTMKRFNGVVSTTVSKDRRLDHDSDMYEVGKKTILLSEDIRATEKNLMDQHKRAYAIFKERINEF
jgi:hypothetical protein